MVSEHKYGSGPNESKTDWTKHPDVQYRHHVTVVGVRL